MEDTERAEPFTEIINRHTAEIRKEIERHLQDQEIADQEIPGIVDDISKKCVEILKAEEAPYKIVAHCSILRKAPGCHFYASSSCLWENESDAGVSVRWDSDAIMCAVTVFGLQN